MVNALCGGVGGGFSIFDLFLILHTNLYDGIATVTTYHLMVCDYCFKIQSLAFCFPLKLGGPYLDNVIGLYLAG